MMGWALAMWKQVRGWPTPDPWDNDPDIIAARVRQDEKGITETVTRWRLEQEFWRRRHDRMNRREVVNARS